MKKSDWMAIVIFQVIAQMLFMWCIDVSVSAMLNNGIITSGFITSSPMLMYHVCLYASVLNLAFMCLIAVHFVLKGE